MVKHSTRKHRHTKRSTKRSTKRNTKRSKSYRRRHTRKRGGACGPCGMRGGRGYTTGAAATLAQYNGTPGLARGGRRSRGGELNPGAEEFVPAANAAAAKANANLNSELAAKKAELEKMINTSNSQ